MWRNLNKIQWSAEEEKQYKEGLMNRISVAKDSIENFPWSAGLTQEIELLKTKGLTSIEEDLKNNNEIFDKIRLAQKKEGNIFLYGNSTTKIMDIMIKLYHENILRILKNKFDKKKVSKMMCGIIELDNGDVYVTISESPFDGGNNSEYPKKIKDLYNLLRNANIEVEYPEKEEEKEFPKLETLNFFPDTYELWRTDNKNFLYSPSNLRRGGVNYGNVLDEMFIDKETDRSKIKINPILDNCNYKVKLIHSLDYLSIRKNNENMSSENKNPFVPFIRKEAPDPQFPQPYISCNNGSTCVESKLFSYIYDQLHLKFENIIGFVSYWIGDDLPPNHIIESYCYRSNKNKKKNATDDFFEFENEKLEEMLESCIRFSN